MGESLFAAVWLWVPLWSAGLLVVAAVLIGRRTRQARWVVPLLALAVVAVIPVFPVMDARQPRQKPRQVVYRFDDHRWLELKGWECEGALWYVDSKQGIRTEVASKFYRIIFFQYIHPSTRYIAIPWDDMSEIRVSRDGGRTFGPDARIYVEHSNPHNNHVPTAEEVRQFVVIDDRGYIETKDGRVIQSSVPVGEYWGGTYIDYLVPGDMRATDYDEPEFQDMKRKVPEVKDYKGWTHMKCDPNVGVVPPKTSLAGIPGLIYSVEAYTIGAPVYFGWRVFRRSHAQNDGLSGATVSTRTESKLAMPTKRTTAKS